MTQAIVNLRRDCPMLFDMLATRMIEEAKATPYFHLEGYMERWWLQRPDGHGATDDVSDKSKTGHAARIHHILRSDNDRALHCHPWPSTSIVLFGGYWEVLPREQRQHARFDAGFNYFVWREPGDVVQRAATDRHRIVLPEGKTSWSLFLMGNYEKSWFFHDPERGQVPWREYLKDSENYAKQADAHYSKGNMA